MKKLQCSKILLSKYRVLFIINLFSWLITTVGDMVDMIISGYFISDSAASAVEIVNPISNILLFISTFIFMGISTLFARKVGEFHEKEAHEVAGTGLVSAIATGIILAFLMIIFQKLFLDFYKSGTTIDIFARDYYKCFIFIALIYPVYWLIYYLVMIDGDMVTVFIADIINVATNLISSIILVKYYEIKGIGYGTLIGMILSMLILLIHFMKKSNTIHFSFKMKFKSLWESIKIASPTALTILYISVTDIIMNKVVLAEFGEQYLSVYGIINLILNLAICLVCGMSAASPFVCANYGEKNYSAVLGIMNTATKYTFMLSIVFTLIIEGIATKIPSLFGITDAKLVSDAILAIRILGCSYLVSGILSEFIAYYSKIEHIILANILGAVHMLIGPIAITIPMIIILGFNGMVWGFFIIPIVTIIIGLIIIKVKYNIKAIPYIIGEKNNKIKIMDLNIKNGKVEDLTIQVRNFLKENDIHGALKKQIQKCVKDFYQQLKEHNSKKKILADCTIMIENNEIRLIFRDNGNIDKNIVPITTNSKHLYSVTTGFNRNCFIWEMN